MSENENKTYTIYILSDSTGETAATMIRAALVQYSTKDINMIRCKNVRTETQAEAVIEECFERRGMLAYTVASQQLRNKIREMASGKGIPYYDLLGPLLSTLDVFFGEHSEAHVGALRAVDERYFKRIEAIDVVCDGQAAIEILVQKSFDVILMDCHMPNMDGVTATRAIRALGGVYSQIPIIGISADILTLTREKCLSAGMNSVVSKPIDYSVLFFEIEKSPLQTKEATSAISNSLLEPLALQRLRSMNRLGEKDFAEELIEDFLETTPKKIEQILDSLLMQDLVAAYTVAHSLKSSAATIGAVGFRDVAGALEIFCRDNDLDNAREEARVLAESFALLKKGLVLKHLDQISPSY